MSNLCTKGFIVIFNRKLYNVQILYCTVMHVILFLAGIESALVPSSTRISIYQRYSVLTNVHRGHLKDMLDSFGQKCFLSSMFFMWSCTG